MPSPLSSGTRRFAPPRLAIAAVIAIISICGYYGSRQFNPVTNEVQHVSMSVDQEIALGLQAAPELAQQYGGSHPDSQAGSLVDQIGRRIVAQSGARETDYDFNFHLLADEEAINAFALPGGQVFMTAGLAKRLRTDGQIAGVLSHEIGHVVARHGAEHLAKMQLTQGLTGAAVIASYDPDDPESRNTAAVAAAIGQLINMKFGRDDELESDHLGVRFSSEAGYDPRAMLEVMAILAEASEGMRQPEFFSTHPNPERRTERIEAAIAERFPGGVPDGLTP